MKLYRKKPVTIEAVQWDGTAEGATPIIDWVLACGNTARYVDHPATLHSSLCRCDGRAWVPALNLRGPARPCEETEPTGGRPATLDIDTLEGTMSANAGDWIIRGVQGEQYPCKPDIFDATYEPVCVMEPGASRV